MFFVPCVFFSSFCFDLCFMLGSIPLEDSDFLPMGGKVYVYPYCKPQCSLEASPAGPVAIGL